jgi:hypothetical protein
LHFGAPQKAKFKMEWDYSPKGKNLNWSGITPQKANIKLEWDYSPKGKITEFLTPAFINNKT